MHVAVAVLLRRRGLQTTPMVVISGDQGQGGVLDAPGRGRRSESRAALHVLPYNRLQRQ